MSDPAEHPASGTLHLVPGEVAIGATRRTVLGRETRRDVWWEGSLPLGPLMAEQAWPYGDSYVFFPAGRVVGRSHEQVR